MSETTEIVDREIARRLSDALADDWRGFSQIETVEQALVWMCVCAGLRECEAAHVMVTLLPMVGASSGSEQ